MYVESKVEGKILSVISQIDTPCPRVLSSEHEEWELPGPICYLSSTFVSQTPRNTKNSEAGWVIKLRWNQTYPWIVSSKICSLRQGRGLLLKSTDSPRSKSSYSPDTLFSGNTQNLVGICVKFHVASTYWWNALGYANLHKSLISTENRYKLCHRFIERVIWNVIYETTW